jgi:hypothetical protein
LSPLSSAIGIFLSIETLHGEHSPSRVENHRSQPKPARSYASVLF